MENGYFSYEAVQFLAKLWKRKAFNPIPHSGLNCSFQLFFSKESKMRSPAIKLRPKNFENPL